MSRMDSFILQTSKVFTREVDSHIKSCENLLDSESFSLESAIELRTEIAAVYSRQIDGFEDYLTFSREDLKDARSDISLIASKLRVHKDKLIMESIIGGSPAPVVSNTLSQNMSNQMNVSVSFEQTVQAVADLPAASLSDDDRDTLQGMLTAINLALKNDKEEAETKVQKALKWLVDKGSDVIIAAMPYIVSALQQVV